MQDDFHEFRRNDEEQIKWQHHLNSYTEDQLIQGIAKAAVGETKARRFERGFTLKEVLTDYAKKENIILYWYLDKDYVVKDHFRVDGDFITTLYKVSRSINNDFVNEVYTFFCYKQRAAIITELPSEFVRSNCIRLTV